MRDSTNVQAPVEKKAIIAMSGGVDSSVAALLCQQQGFDCVGVTLALTDNSDRGLPEEAFPGERTCCSVDDVADARSVAFRLGMPFYVFNFKEAFRREVMDRFAAAYQRGETPNPCIDCNRYIKFAKLMHRGEEIGFPYVATGHYARVEQDGATGRWLLKKGLDENKDQSYMLYSLTQWELSRLLLPLGGLTKEETRRLAEEHGFVNARKRDSQDICFVPDGDYVSFLRQYGGVEPVPGDFLDSEGRVLGRHRGMECYTIGQRKGLGVSANAPQYVLGKDPDRNAVILGEDNRLYTRELTAERVNWLSVPEPDRPLSVTAKTRYSQREAAATVEPLPGGRIRMVFTEPQRAVTPGQAVVFYDGDLVLGGGTICP